MHARFVLVMVAMWCSAAAARAQAPSEPTASPEAQAAERFRRGVQLFDVGDLAPALVEFERAYELSPHYRVLENIGVVNIRLGRYASAARALRRYLDEGGDAITAEQRAQVEAELNAIALRTATLTLVVHTAAAAITLDGGNVSPEERDRPIVIDAGEHVVAAGAEGFRSRSYPLKLASQEHAEVEITLEPLPRDPVVTPPRFDALPEGRRQPFWPGIIGSAALGAGALVSVGVMARARSELSDLKDEPGSSARAREDQAHRANVAAVTTDVLTGLTLLGCGVTLYLSLRRVPGASTPTLALGPREVALRVRLR